MSMTIQNRNEASADHFRLIFRNISQTVYTCQAANIPGISGTALTTQSYLNPYHNPGDKLNYSDFNISFKVDEDLNNYKELFNWMKQIYHPESFDQYKQHQELETNIKTSRTFNDKEDATLFSLTNAYNANIEINFRGLFPISLSDLNFSLGDNQIVIATASFKFDYYDIN